MLSPGMVYLSTPSLLRPDYYLIVKKYIFINRIHPDIKMFFVLVLPFILFTYCMSIIILRMSKHPVRVDNRNSVFSSFVRQPPQAPPCSRCRSHRPRAGVHGQACSSPSGSDLWIPLHLNDEAACSRCYPS